MDLKEILRQLMIDGGVKIEITITPLDNGLVKGDRFITCPACKKSFGPYTRASSAKRALSGHVQHCAALNGTGAYT